MEISCFYKGTRKNTTGGFAALLTIIIVSASSFLMAYSASMLGLGELDLGYTAQKGSEALTVADGCLEEALYRLRLDVDYGGGTVTSGLSSCTISVSGSGLDRTIAIAADIESTFYKHLEVEVTLSGTVYPTITVTNWNEVSG